MAAGVGDRAHAAERDAEQAGLGIAAAQRPDDLFQPLCNVAVEVEIRVRVERGDIGREAATAHGSDEAGLDEGLRARLRRWQHDQERRVRLRRAVEDDAHGGWRRRGSWWPALLR